MKEANVLTEHAAAEPLAVDPAAHIKVHDSGSAVLITAATAVNMRSTHTKEGARGWIARERCQRSDRACCGIVEISTNNEQTLFIAAYDMDSPESLLIELPGTKAVGILD